MEKHFVRSAAFHEKLMKCDKRELENRKILSFPFVTVDKRKQSTQKGCTSRDEEGEVVYQWKYETLSWIQRSMKEHPAHGRTSRRVMIMMTILKRRENAEPCFPIQPIPRFAKTSLYSEQIKKKGIMNGKHTQHWFWIQMKVCTKLVNNWWKIKLLASCKIDKSFCFLSCELLMEKAVKPIRIHANILARKPHETLRYLLKCMEIYGARNSRETTFGSFSKNLNRFLPSHFPTNVLDLRQMETITKTKYRRWVKR